MEYRTFGTTDLNISPMGLGCMRMSGVYGPADERESIATLHRAFDLGINRWQSPWPGCWPRGKTSSRFPAARPASILRKT